MTVLCLALFFSTVALCFAAYFGYPLFVACLPRAPRPSLDETHFTPQVSLLIAAYNEAQHIATKARNSLAQDYPADKLEIFVGSDGSTDETPALLAAVADPRVKSTHFPVNRGKTSVQNDLVALSRGEILVFTDAASFIPPDAVRKLVRNFADPRVGCVAGRMRFIGTDANLTTQSQGLYWRYEAKLRELESRIGSLIGVDGPLYAVRRECYVPLEPHVISDLVTPLLVLEQGRKVVLETEALVDEDPTVKGHQEFRTRRRVVLRGLTGLWTYRRLLNPLKHPLLATQLILHKLLRWLVGPLAMVNLGACIALLPHWFFVAMTCGYAAFAAAAALGWLLDRRGVTVRALTVPYYFTLVNAAATMALIDFVRRKQATTWKPVRH